MRKYCEYYISVEKKENGYIWKIWNKSQGTGKEVVQSSMDADEDDRYYETDEVAYQEAAEAIQYYYI